MEGKYGKLLTVILVIVVIGVLALIGFLGFDLIKKFTTEKTIADIVDQYDNMINSENVENTESNVGENSGGISGDIPILNETLVDNSGGSSSGSSTSKVTYQGYDVVGKIEIPAIDLEYPILDRATATSIELAVAVQYGPGPNQAGNTVIVGHNYRNGDFFGSNDKLELGDKVYITDNSGTKIKYNIYNIYETSPEDSDYMMRDTNGKREISLSTCTDNSKARLIIWAVEE